MTRSDFPLSFVLTFFIIEIKFIIIRFSGSPLLTLAIIRVRAQTVDTFWLLKCFLQIRYEKKLVAPALLHMRKTWTRGNSARDRSLHIASLLKSDSFVIFNYPVFWNPGNVLVAGKKYACYFASSVSYLLLALNIFVVVCS